jgi:hypothetical protein
LPAFFAKKSLASSTLFRNPIMIDLSVDQARKIIAVAPKDSPYYQEAQKVLFSKGYVPAPMRFEDDAPPCRPGT